jgi:hypothetical protein
MQGVKGLLPYMCSYIKDHNTILSNSWRIEILEKM